MSVTARNLFVSPLVALLLFAWGFAAHRNHIFPFALLSALAGRSGLGGNVHAAVPPSSRATPLDSLAYVTSTYDPNAHLSGVFESNQEKYFSGFNFESRYHAPSAKLRNMAGELLHEWSWPDPREITHHVELLPDGSLLVILENSQILKLDLESSILWKADVSAHHGLAVTADGRIFAVSSRNRLIPEIHETIPLMEDTLTVLEPDGEILESFSLVTPFLGSRYEFLLPSIATLQEGDAEKVDLLHVNHVQVFDGSSESKGPLFRAGNLLLSARHLNAIWILDGETHQILWLWGPNKIALSHHPSLLDTGNILLFDNGRKESRAVEVSVPDGRIVWAGRPTEDFFSWFGGRAQRLPNGNTLLTETAKGYAYEIDPSSEIVWAYALPEVSEQSMRGSLWQVKRISREQLAAMGWQ